MSFNNPIAALSGALSFPSIHSPDYTTSGGTTGWSINRDGTATFNTTGGSLQITNNGVFFYVPNAGTGNLFASYAAADGIDPYGNSYHKGYFVNQHQGWFTSDAGHTVVINPDGTTGPQLLFFPSGFNAIIQMLVEGPANRMLFQPVNSSNAVVEFNGPVIATGGIEGVNTAQGAQPPFNVTGSFVDYLTASWAPLVLVCPPSETIIINTNVFGYNNNTANSTLAISPRIKQGATTLMAPVQGQSGPSIRSPGAGAVQNVQGFVQYVVGNDVLGGRNGQTITIVPAWRISSGGAVDCNVNFASMSAYPSMFRQAQSG